LSRRNPINSFRLSTRNFLRKAETILHGYALYLYGEMDSVAPPHKGSYIRHGAGELPCWIKRLLEHLIQTRAWLYSTKQEVSEWLSQTTRERLMRILAATAILYRSASSCQEKALW
jgi:hypothetical protein